MSELAKVSKEKIKGGVVMHSKLLSPMMDFIFKKIFGNENNPEILISFLNSVLKPESPINSVEIKNTDIEKNHINDKFSRLDIKATTSNNELINIEIQVKDEYNMIQRSLYYWSRLYHEQIGKGEDYEKLNRTVCINILDFKLLEDDKFHSVYRFKEVTTNKELTKIAEIHFIEVPKLKKLDVDENIDLLEGWIEFLRNPESEVVRKLEMDNKEIREAKDELYRLSGDEKERELYFMREKAYRDEISALSSAERKGRKDGVMDVARSLLDVLDVETIALKTKLTVEEVNKLKYEQENN